MGWLDIEGERAKEQKRERERGRYEGGTEEGKEGGRGCLYLSDLRASEMRPS